MWLSYLLTFVLSGAVVAGVRFLAINVGERFAAVLYVVPVQFTASVLAIYFGSTSETVRAFASSSLYGVAVLAIFVVGFAVLLRYISFWYALGGAYLLFGIGATVMLL